MRASSGHPTIVRDVWIAQPLVTWAIACQILLVAVVLFGLEQRVADASPVLLLLAGSGLAALLVPTLKRANDTPKSSSASHYVTSPGQDPHAEQTAPRSAPPQQDLVSTPPQREPANVAPPSAALIAQICHELRTPLNAVIGFSSLMAREIHGPVGHPRYQEYVDHIMESGHSLLRSADATLALTTALTQPAARGHVSNLAAAVEEAAVHITSPARESIRDKVRALPDDMIVAVEPGTLAQALRHILAHATAVAEPTDDAIAISIERLDAGILRLCVGAKGGATHARAGLPLSILIARTLLESSGAGWSTDVTTCGAWIISLDLPIVTVTPPRTGVGRHG